MWEVDVKCSNLIRLDFICPRYPSEADKHLLSRQTGLSKNQVLITSFRISSNYIDSSYLSPLLSLKPGKLHFILSLINCF